jgi:hypothetical protein
LRRGYVERVVVGSYACDGSHSGDVRSNIFREVFVKK